MKLILISILVVSAKIFKCGNPEIRPKFSDMLLEPTKISKNNHQSREFYQIKTVEDEYNSYMLDNNTYDYSNYSDYNENTKNPILHRDRNLSVSFSLKCSTRTQKQIRVLEVEWSENREKKQFRFLFRGKL